MDYEVRNTNIEVRALNPKVRIDNRQAVQHSEAAESIEDAFEIVEHWLDAEEIGSETIIEISFKAKGLIKHG